MKMESEEHLLEIVHAAGWRVLPFFAQNRPLLSFKSLEVARGQDRFVFLTRCGFLSWVVAVLREGR